MTLYDNPGLEIERLTSELDRVRRENRLFREQVRDRIIEAYKDGDICLSGMNRGLDDLGLAEYVECFYGTVTLTVEVRVDETEDEDVAAQWARDAIFASSQNDDVQVLDFERVVGEFEGREV